MRRLRRFAPWSVLPAAIWVLAQIVMTGAFSGAQAGAPAQVSADETVIICTPQGPRTIPAAEVFGNADQAPAPATAGDDCPWCQILASVDLPQRIACPARLALHAPAVFGPSHAVPLPPRRAAEGFRSRAPPV